MNKRIDLYDIPTAKEIYMIAGWRQWADAGSISSGMPEYLIEELGARKIGEILPDDFYIFQIPGTHHLMRPVISFEDGYRQALEVSRNELYYFGTEDKGLIIFLGDEPQLNVHLYAEAFFDVVKQLKVRRIGVLGGVYAPMPFEKDREVGCIYSLPRMRAELETYAVRFSNYEGGATIGSYLVDRAEEEGVEFFAFYSLVPAYDFAQSSVLPQGLRIEDDFRAWYELMRRFNHMFGLSINLNDLEMRSEELTVAMEEQIVELEEKMPQLNPREFLAEVAAEFTERPFEPLDDVWSDELDDLFGDEKPAA